jgi:hypothetical protein
MRQLSVACVLSVLCGCGGNNAVVGGDLGDCASCGDGGGAGGGGGSDGGGARCLAGGLGNGHLMIGFSGDDAVAPQAPFDVRYEYLSGGVADGAGPCASCASGCTAAGKSCANSAGGCAWWGCWQYDQDPPGAYVRSFVQTASGAGEIPMITWYQLLQSSGVAEGSAEVTQAATDATFMARYLADFRFMLQQIGSSRALIHVEPDFWGYAEQVGSDPHGLPAAVASANPTDCASEENSIAGLGRCFVDMARAYAPNAQIGLHASGWSTKMDALGNASASLDVAGEAAKTTAFLGAAGGDKMDFVAVDYSDRDAGFYMAMGRNTWWDATNATLPSFTQALTWTKAIGGGLNKPVVVWQIPVGNSQMNDTCDHYKDNRVDYLLGHTADVVAANVAALAFGAGASCNTTPSTDNGNLIAKTKSLSMSGGQAACP